MYAVFEDRNGRKMASDWLNCKNRPIGTRGEFLTLLSYLSLPQPRKKQKQQARGLFFFFSILDTVGARSSTKGRHVLPCVMMNDLLIRIA